MLLANRQPLLPTMIKRINLWSGPRNISTATMYAFAQRADTRVFDEPLYAHYLNKTSADEYHPGAAEILADMENDGSKVIEMMLGNHDRPIVFFKQMTHHLVELDWSFMDEMTNLILTRDPRDMLPSYAQQVETPTMIDVGYAAHLQLIKYLQKKRQEIIVLDAKKVLENPEKIFTRLSEKINIPFDPAMLSWSAGPRPEDGIWAKHWYKNVHKSTGFGKYKEKTDPFPEKLIPLFKQCQPIYDQLQEWVL